MLAYHYLTQGNTDAGVSQFKEVVALTPQDTLSAQLVKQFSPPAAAPDTAAATTASPPAATTAKQGNLAGNWTAHPAGDTTIDLRIADDESFTWKVTAKGKPRQLPGNGHSPKTCSRWLRKATQEHWSAVSPGKPVTSGASASSGRVPRIRGCSLSLNARRSNLGEFVGRSVPVRTLSGPGDRACFLPEFPESPVSFDSVMVCQRSVRLAGIHQFLVIRWE